MKNKYSALVFIALFIWLVCMSIAYLYMYLIDPHVANYLPVAAGIIFYPIAAGFYRYHYRMSSLIIAITMLTIGAISHALLTYMIFNHFDPYLNTWYFLRFHLVMFLGSWVGASLCRNRLKN